MAVLQPKILIIAPWLMLHSHVNISRYSVCSVFSIGPNMAELAEYGMAQLGLIGPSWGCKGSSLGLTGFSQGPRGSIQEPSGPTYTLSGLRWGLEWLIQGLVLTKQGHGAADCVEKLLIHLTIWLKMLSRRTRIVKEIVYIITEKACFRVIASVDITLNNI